MNNSERHIDRLEFDIVVEGTAVGVGLPRHHELLELSCQDPDWARVGQLATYHGVYPILFQALEHHVEDVPADIIERMHRGYIDTAARNLQQIQELGRVSRLLEAGGVRMISFKGPVLAHEAYHNLALRPSIDLDLLVASDEFDKAAAVLMEDGYAPVSRQDVGGLKRSVHRYLSQQVPFVKDRTYALDVHMNIMPPGYFYAFSFDTLHARSHVARIAGQSIHSFQAEDVLQILCYHGVKNRWERVKHVCDVVCVIRSENLDWDVVLKRSEETRGERVLATGLYLARSLLHVELPTEVRALVDEASRARDLGDWVLERIPNNMETGLADLGERIRLYLGIQDTLANKARYCAYSLLRRLD